jgi:hypothetical protein
MFEYAMRQMLELEQNHNTKSVAFEILGPPRLSKLLYEAYLFSVAFDNMKSVVNTPKKMLSSTLYELIKKNIELRAQIISIGIPILLPDGKTLLRGKEVKIPPFRGENSLQITPSNIDAWAHDGWIDLRDKNMVKWQERMKLIMNQAGSIPPNDSSSRYFRNAQYWSNFEDIQPGKLVGWIFSEEEKGARMKA